VLARFSGPLRATVLLVAGIAEMPPLPDCRLDIGVLVGVRPAVARQLGR
jgi:hypothetical protein